MKEHSPTAWRIASLYHSVLASETRDLAAHIDMAINRERERCAKIAEAGCLVPPDGGSPTVEEKEMCDGIAKAIRRS